MDVTYVNPFITSTIDTFKTMLNTEVKPGVPRAKKEPLPTYDISGIIGLSGDAQGSIAISFPKVMALKLVSTMMGMTIKVIGPDLTDGIGEIANIIAGNAKQHFNGLNLMISLPNVVIGRNHTLSTQKGVPTLVVPFGAPSGEFVMEVSLKT
ncbi:MAG: chemotaxis protein CheX [Chitinivibrionales bacterium]|nr:chemotaxis protein CheX [Chitinivibrionales bacterium]